MIEFKKFLFNFVIGGFSIAIITYFIEKIQPELASILWAAPFALFCIIFLSSIMKVPNLVITNFVSFTIVYLFLTLLFNIIFCFLLKKTYLKTHKYGILISLFIVSFLYLLIAFIIYHYKINNYLVNQNIF